MEPIDHLDSLRRATLGSVSIRSCTVAADHLDAGIGLEPTDEGLCLAVWQHLYHAVGLEVNQDGAIAIALFPGSGKGSDVAITPSPKNRTGGFPHIRLKPFVPPV
jgi:hypothetical protein